MLKDENWRKNSLVSRFMCFVLVLVFTSSLVSDVSSFSFTTHAQFPSFLLEVVVRLYLVIVNSDCSHNYCMLHIAITGFLRCCPYKFGAECSFTHWKFEKQPNVRPKKGDDTSAAAIVKDVRQFSGVSQDVEPPESAAISWKGTEVLGPIRRVRFTRAALRQAHIRENKGPSLGKIQVKVPHQRSCEI